MIAAPARKAPPASAPAFGPDKNAAVTVTMPTATQI
jgi:hypothetical protein